MEIDPGYIPYTEATILELLKLMPKFESIRGKGMLIAQPPVEYKASKEDKKDWWNITSGEMWRRHNRKTNSVYRVDDVGPVLIDFERALENAISPKARARLKLHFLYGYSNDEIAQAEGVSVSAIENGCTRAIEKMVDYLETPREYIPLGREMKEEVTHRRKYQTFPK